MLDIEVAGMDIGVGIVREGMGTEEEDDFVLAVLLPVVFVLFGDNPWLFGCGYVTGIVVCCLLLLLLLFLFGSGIIEEEGEGGRLFIDDCEREDAREEEFVEL